MTDRRTEDRAPLRLEARLEGTSGRSNAHVTDISVDGCYIETWGRVTVGDVVSFEVQLPSGEWLPLRGEVTHELADVGFGICFTFLTDEEQRLIAQLQY